MYDAKDKMVIPETNADLDKSAKDIFNKGYVQLDVKTKSASGVWEKLQMTACERRKFMCSVIFHVIATICVVWWLYWLIDRIFDEIRQGILEWPFWTKLVVVAIIFIIGLVIMCVQCKVYIQLWRRLKAYNRVIYVKNHPETCEKNVLDTPFFLEPNLENKEALGPAQSDTNSSQYTETDCSIEILPV